LKEPTPVAHLHQGYDATHGPYFHWTRKIRQKTVGRWLSAEQREDYAVWVDNDRRMRELLGRLEALGIAKLEADERSRSPHASS